MDWILPNNKIIRVPTFRYRIDWDAPAKSKESQVIQDFLRPYWAADVVCAEFRIPHTKLKVDYINFSKKISWEHNGIQHSEFNKFFHNNSRATYLAAIRRDGAKIVHLERNDFLIIETTKEDFPYLSYKFFEKKFGVSL
jgi:hypothetical protein